MEQAPYLILLKDIIISYCKRKCCRGYDLILPQKEAMKFFDGKKFNTKKICFACAERAAKTPFIILNLDGSTADDGTSLEGGIALFPKLFPKLYRGKADAQNCRLSY